MNDSHGFKLSSADSPTDQYIAVPVPVPVPVTMTSTYQGSSEQQQQQSNTSTSTLPSAPLQDNNTIPASNNVTVDINESTSKDQFSITLINNGASIKVHCTPDWTVAQLKQFAFPLESSNPAKQIRCIYLGKLITNDNLTLRQLNVENGYTMHVHISDRPVGVDGQQYEYSNVPHHGIPIGANAEYPAGQYAQQYQQMFVPQGLDYYGNQPANAVHQHNMLMMQQYEGNTSDFVLGFLMGIVLGPLSLFWLFLSSTPRRQRAGIMSGLFTNVFIAIGRVIFEDPNNQQQGGGNNNGSNP
jgi:hypothetical protein